MKQVPSSFCFYAVSSMTGASGGAHAASGERFQPVIYTAQSDDEDIGAMFNKALIEYAHMLYNKYEKYPKAMIITDNEQAAFERSTHCHICEQKLIRREDCADDEQYAICSRRRV
jgi:hypothetical protein